MSLSEQEYIFVGPVLPAAVRHGGRFSSEPLPELIKSSIITVLSVPKGTRFNMYDFGSILHELVFEPNDIFLKAAMKREVIGSLEVWEPRIELDPNRTDVIADVHDVQIVIAYMIKSLSIPDVLTLYAKRNAPLILQRAA